MILDGVKELAPPVWITPSYEAFGVPRSSFYHAQQPATPRVAPQPHPPSPCALSDVECPQIREVLNSERLVDRAPRTIYAILLDEGQCLCSWHTMYRIMVADAATRERRSLRQHPSYARPELLSSAPCQVWTWDITKRIAPGRMPPYRA